MAVITLHAQVVLPSLSGLAKDSAINTFTFSGDVPDTPAVAAAAIEPSLENFYNVQVGGGLPIATYLARNRSRATGAVETRWYDVTAHLNGTAAGPPVLIENWTLGAQGTTDSLPEEVAAAISFHGSFGTLAEFGPGSRPRARHRGRVFIGPLTVNTLSVAGPLYQPRPSAAFIADLATSANELMEANGTGWCVWSRRNAAVYPIVGGWVDDAYDTIRGRGPEPLARTDWGVIV